MESFWDTPLINLFSMYCLKRFPLEGIFKAYPRGDGLIVVSIILSNSNSLANIKLNSSLCFFAISIKIV